LKRKEAFLVWN